MGKFTSRHLFTYGGFDAMQCDAMHCTALMLHCNVMQCTVMHVFILCSTFMLWGFIFSAECTIGMVMGVACR